MEEVQSPVKETKRLNVNVPSDLKKRLGAFCAKEEMTIKEVTEMAIEGFLDSMEASKQ